MPEETFTLQDLDKLDSQALDAETADTYTLEDLDRIDSWTEPKNGVTKILENFGKGFASDLTRIPGQVGTLIKETGERGGAGLAIPAFRDGISIVESMRGERIIEGPADETLIRVGDKLNKKNKEFMQRLNLQPTDDEGASKFAFDVGSGTSSVITSLGLLYATRSPTLPALLFGSRQKAEVFEEARAAAKTPEEAAAISSAAGLIEGGIEQIGGASFLKAISFNKFITRALVRAGIEGLEEGAQQTGEESLLKLTGVRNDSLRDVVLRIGYASAIGLIIGVPAGSVTSAIEKIDIKKDLKALGLNDKQSDLVIQKVSEKTIADGTVKAEIEKFIDEEIATSEKLLNDNLPKQEAEVEKKPGAVIKEPISEQELSELVEKSSQDFTTIPELKQLDELRKSDETATELEKTLAQIEAREGSFLGDRIQEKSIKFPSDKKGIKKLKGLKNVSKFFDDAPGNPSLDEIARQEGFSSGIQFLETLKNDEAQRREDIKQGKRIRKLLKDFERNVFKRQKDIARLQRTVETKRQRFQPQAFEQARRSTKTTASEFQEKTGRFFGSVGDFLDQVGGTISTRLANINPKLRDKIRRFEFDVKNKSGDRIDKVKDYAQGLKDMPAQDFAVLDLALKNGNFGLADGIHKRHGLESQFESVRETLDELYREAESVNLNVRYLKNFIPRVVSDSEGMIDFFKKSENWSAIEKALQEKRVKLGRELRREEMANLINQLLRGYKSSQIQLVRPGAVKERQIDFIDNELNQFYKRSDEAIADYINTITDAVESRRFFGKDKKFGEDEDIQNVIGTFVLDLMQKGEINLEQEQELTDILRARFNQGRMTTAGRVFKQSTLIFTLGRVTSMITQIGDIGFSLHKNGVGPTIRTIGDIAGVEKVLSKEDIGVKEIAEEFNTSSKLAAATKKTFDLVGFTAMDSFGKKVFINSALSSLSEKAKDGDTNLKNEVKRIFGKESDQVLEDLKNSETSENVKFLLFSRLLDVQPIALSEVPETYLRAGNGRIFYMLKTFTIKQIDVFRNDVFQKISSKDKAVQKEGWRNFLSLTGSMLLMGITADTLKDLILGRPFELGDSVIDNILKFMGFNKFILDQAKREGLSVIAESFILPPLVLSDLVSAVYKDIEKHRDLSEARTPNKVPIVGQFYYYWFGKGSEINGGKSRKI